MASSSSSVTASATAAAAPEQQDLLLSGHAGREQMRLDADTVLVLIDAECSHVAAAANDDDASERQAAVLANVQRLRSAWISRGLPVLAVGGGVVRLLVDGGPQSPPPSLLPVNPDASTFISTNLDYVLRRLLPTRSKPRCFVVAGSGAERAVESTVRDAADKGCVALCWVGFSVSI